MDRPFFQVRLILVVAFLATIVITIVVIRSKKFMQNHHGTAAQKPPTDSRESGNAHGDQRSLMVYIKLL